MRILARQRRDVQGRWGQMTRNEVRAQVEQIGILPFVRVRPRSMRDLRRRRCNRAGIPEVEVARTFPGALSVIHDLAKRYPDLAIGAGTVLDEGLARQAIDAGARFLTSPGFVPEVVAYANKADVVVFPGALTPTEVIAAWKAGSDFVKIIPLASMGGVRYVRALKVSLPQIPASVSCDAL
jgi:2-dehydro-3-deoxyphosphogluconate aldolase/(4S)-4-hydroxy-2-oxoglutarate aldolase